MAENSQELQGSRLEVERDRALTFLQRWKTDVEPAHGKTERSRDYRTQYWQIALKSLLLLNAGALIGVPAAGKLLGAPLTRNLELFLRSERCFVLGIFMVLIATLFSLVTLDTDVIRQKGERALARQRLIEIGFPDRHGDSLESERVKSERHQRKYWRIGVGLFWTSVVLMLLSSLSFVNGLRLTAELLISVAG